MKKNKYNFILKIVFIIFSLAVYFGLVANFCFAKGDKKSETKKTTEQNKKTKKPVKKETEKNKKTKKENKKTIEQNKKIKKEVKKTIEQNKKQEGRNEQKINKDGIAANAINGAVLIDASNGDVLFERNCEKVAQMASTTKIMTCILAIENTKDMDKFIEVDGKSIEDLEGTSMWLKKGDFVNMRGLLTGMLLKSGNDAANEAAVRVVKELIERGEIELTQEEKDEIELDSNGVKKYIEKFVGLMNKKAKKLGLKNTKFSSPSGLGPEDVLYSENYKQNETTAKELAYLAQYAMKSEIFRDICGSVSRKVEFSEDEDGCVLKEKRPYSNSNRLIKKNSGFYYKFATGIKTGFTKQAGRCLVASAEKDGVTLIAVVLNDKTDWKDCMDLFEYGFSKYKQVGIKKLIPEEYKIENKKFQTIGQEGRDAYFKVIEKKPLDKISLRKEKIKDVDVKTKIKINPIIFTVKKGEKVGDIEYYLNGELFDTVEILSDRDA